MDKDSAPLSRDRVQLLYQKNIELENKRRKSTQSRIPFDTNSWQQMRENYESIILEDHNFSEQQNIEYALWQLHYRRIEELRTHFQSALSSSATSASQAPIVPGRIDRVTKIRTQFKTFLSEASGFYHDLILKIRSKYGLPLGYFSEDVDCVIVKEKDGKNSLEVKKGLISCHRCLIYLGDLARYKGLYGEGDSKTREYAAASSYYLQAASLWPSSGNPHHQLAILASYSGDELVAVYRYFRSLAVENPFITARDNLIVAFEKNRQSFSQLLGEVKVSLKEAPPSNGKRKVKGDMKHAHKNLNVDTSSKCRESSNQDTLKSFCVPFVRLHGVLFTRTSLETFEEVLGLTTDAFCELLSSEEEDKLPFGANATENSFFAVCVISTLIFTVHNVKKEAEGQTYAEIVQKAVLLQNAFTAAFEISGHVLERVSSLADPTSSFLIPGILVFLEWLACHPDVATANEANKKQSNARINFWNNCVLFLNKILSSVSGSLEDNEDDLCFNNMSRYEEGETDNRLALWEDFELRGFIPILPAQVVLDFSRKHSSVTCSNKEKSARMKRILAAGRALSNVVKVDQMTVWFDSRNKKFFFGDLNLHSSDDHLLSAGNVELKDEKKPEDSETTAINAGCLSNPQICAEVEEDDEVIVFKPLVVDTPSLTSLSPKTVSHDNLRASQSFYRGSSPLNRVTDLSSSMIQNYPVYSATPISASSESILHKLQSISGPPMNWSSDITADLSHTLKNVKFMENGHLVERSVANEPLTSHPVNGFVRSHPAYASPFYAQSKKPEVMTASNLDILSSSGAHLDNNIGKKSDHSTTLKKIPISRPARHLGPPPGFGHVASKQMVEPISEIKIDTSPADDYSWLDGYQMPTRYTPIQNLDMFTVNAANNFKSNNEFTGKSSFPFPGKQNLTVQPQGEYKNMWQSNQVLDHLKAQEQVQQQVINGNQQLPAIPEQNHGQSIWSGRYTV